MSKKPLRLLLLTTLVAFSTLATSAQAGQRWNTDDHGVVLGGYDVVAYHTQDEAVQGSADFAAEYAGGRFYFSTAKNRDAFRKDPAKYAPQFGGFCAFGIAKNHAKVPTDPKTFKIYNGELLLFFNDMYQGQHVNTKILWNQDEKELHHQSHSIWPTLD